MFAGTVVALLIQGVFARPDLTDMVSKNMKSIGGGASIFLFAPYNGNRYELSMASTSVFFSYETFLQNKWSFEVSPSVYYANFVHGDQYFSLGTTAGFNFYFNDHDLLPYINAGVAFGLDQFGQNNSITIKPTLSVGLVKEIKDQLYFDIGVHVPTFIGFSSNNNGNRFGLVDITFPVYFGIQYYYM